MENIVYICKFCGSIRKNLNSLHCHERLCKENPNRKESSFKAYNNAVKRGEKEKKFSNQYEKAKILGLKIESKLKGKVGPNKGKHLSDEQKRKMSETMKRKIAEGSFVVPYKRNHSSKISYPEKYFMEVLKDLNLVYNYQVGRYQLDFADPEKKIYIEIDGEQHYVDKKIIEHDIERTNVLIELGWKCVRRIRWSEYLKLDEQNKKNFCKNLINEFKNLIA